MGELSTRVIPVSMATQSVVSATIVNASKDYCKRNSGNECLPPAVDAQGMPG